MIIMVISGVEEKRKEMGVNQRGNQEEEEEEEEERHGGITMNSFSGKGYTSCWFDPLFVS